MGTTAYGGKGCKGSAANGDRPVGAARCRRDHHAMASCQPPPPPPAPGNIQLWPGLVPVSHSTPLSTQGGQQVLAVHRAAGQPQHRLLHPRGGARVHQQERGQACPHEVEPPVSVLRVLVLPPRPHREGQPGQAQPEAEVRRRRGPPRRRRRCPGAGPRAGGPPDAGGGVRERRARPQREQRHALRHQQVHGAPAVRGLRRAVLAGGSDLRGADPLPAVRAVHAGASDGASGGVQGLRPDPRPPDAGGRRAPGDAAVLPPADAVRQREDADATDREGMRRPRHGLVATVTYTGAWGSEAKKEFVCLKLTSNFGPL